jgi:transposase
MIVFL